MLIELTIQNLALIDSLHLDFKKGFNVLTGETGAGKSILVGSISLLLGGKGTADFIRFGEDFGEVSGVFQVDQNPEALQWLKSREIAPEEGKYITLRRILRREGRSSAYIQSSSVPINDLEELSSFLLDLHGQHQHQSLFRVDVHRTLLDRYLGLEEEALSFNAAFRELQETIKKLSEATSESQNLKDQQVLWKKQLEEILKGDLKPGEEDELRLKEKRLLSFDQLLQSLDQIHGAFAGDRGLLSSLRLVKTEFDKLQSLDPEYQKFFSRAENAFIDLEDLAQETRTQRLSMDFDPSELTLVQERLGSIYTLEKKYGATEELVLEKGMEIREKLDRCENFDEYIQELESRKSEQEKQIRQKAISLSQKRKSGKGRLEEGLKSILGELGMPNLTFSISITQKNGPLGGAVLGPFGMDYVEFLFSPNPGQPLKPVKDIASGGELSRIMLGLKSLLSHADNIEVLIFDEIDSGIGGEIGNNIGLYLQKLGKEKQVLCITHLASVASYGNHHYFVRKLTENEKTKTQVDVLGPRERVVEIARMLSGDKEGEVSLEHAKNLLKKNVP